MSKWEMVKLGDVCEIERGGSPRPIEKFITDDKNGINWIKIGDTTADSKYITETKQKIIPEGMKKSRYVQSGDFLLSNSMSFGRPYILKTDGCIHDGWLSLRDKKNHFNKDYLYYALSSKSTYEKFKSLAVGGVVNNLNSSKVKQVEFPLPPLETQKQIAKTLDTAAELLTMRKQQLAELDNLIKSTFYEMFGDPVTNDKGWKIVKISDFYDDPKSSVKCGPFGSALKKEEYVEKGVPVWVMDNITKQGGFINEPQLFITEDKFRELESYNVLKNDIIISRAGTVGKMCVVSTDYSNSIISTNLIRLRINQNVLPLYIVKLITIWGNRVCRLKTGSDGAFTHMNTGVLDSIAFPYPPLDLQLQYAEIVAKIEEQKALVKKAIDETQHLFDSLMSEYFE